MRRMIAVLGSLLAASLMGASAAQAAVSINVGSASGNPGDTVSVSVTLTADANEMVAGTQNDVAFDASAPVARKANGKPDCTVNPDIDKSGTSFAFRPANCAADACTAIRALVLSTENTTPIPTGSVLYTCRVAIAASATAGAKALTNSGVIASDPTGTRVAGASGNSGAVTVNGGGPSPTPTEGAGCTVRPAPAGPALYVEDLALSAAGAATITAKLVTGGQDIAGTQNDIAFAANVTVNRKANGKPDCAVNPDIDKSGTSFAFRPANCAAGACTGIRALVLSTENTTPIPNGATLYTCNVTVAGSGGTLAVSGVILSSPTGTRVTPAGSQDGVVCVGGAGPSPTPTTPTGACDPPRAAPAGPALYVVDQNLDAGTTMATISVKLATGGQEIAGTQNDIAFASTISVNRKANGKPDCTVNPDIDKSGTSFAFRPANCAVGACTGIRALVLSTENTTPIPDGSVLYTCNVTVGGSGTLAVSGVILSSPTGTRVTPAGSQDGIICTGGPQPPSPTPTTPQVTPATNTPTRTFTSPPQPTTPSATRTASATAKATSTRIPGTPTFLEDEGGCHISASNEHSGWLLLLPLAGLFLIRRRSR